jgi:hypothetical protein
VRRPWTGRLLRELLASGVPSFPMTFAAMSCIADHEFPHSPENVFTECLLSFGVCALADLMNNDVGSCVALRRDLGPALGSDTGTGDAVLEVILDAPLLETSPLASVAYISSSTDISRRVRGRSVELLLDVDSEAPLAGFMACAHQAEQVRLELHGPSVRSSWVDAWQGIT